MSLVLLIDDEASVRRAYARILRSLEAVTAVMEAEHGEEGLDKFLGQPREYGLIISDFDMPVMNGLTFLEAVQNYSHPPCLMMSGCADENLLSEVRERGGIGLLFKPVPADTFCEVVGELLQDGQSSALEEYHRNNYHS